MREPPSAILATLAEMARGNTTGQARFSNRFTQAQKDALLKAVLIDGHTVMQARELAASGQLEVPAFTIGNYAYDVIREGRDGFEGRNEQALDRAIDDALRLDARAALAHDRAIRAGLKRDGTDNPDDVRRSALALSAVKRARKEAGQGYKAPARAKVTPDHTDAESVNTPQSPSVVTDLLAKAGGSGRTGSLNPAPRGHAA